MLTHLLAVTALGLLCGAWVLLQRAGGSDDTTGGKCGACAGGCRSGRSMTDR